MPLVEWRSRLRPLSRVQNGTKQFSRVCSTAQIMFVTGEKIPWRRPLKGYGEVITNNAHELPRAKYNFDMLSTRRGATNMRRRRRKNNSSRNADDIFRTLVIVASWYEKKCWDSKKSREFLFYLHFFVQLLPNRDRASLHFCVATSNGEKKYD